MLPADEWNMDDTYLVEIRLARTRWRIKGMINTIVQKFGVAPYQELHPHITLYGPFTLDHPSRELEVIEAIKRCASHAGPVTYLIDGWERRTGMHGGVIAFSIIPSKELRDLVSSLSAALTGSTISLNIWDRDPLQKWFHTTIANGLSVETSVRVFDLMEKDSGSNRENKGIQFTVSRIWTFFADLISKGGTLRRQNSQILPVLLDDAGLRITVLHNENIIGEFDLLQQRWLTPEEGRDPGILEDTYTRYRQRAGFELSEPVSHTEGEIFLISDLHLGHTNIIRYCSRPFVQTDVAGMNRVLVSNWNYCVTPQDRIFFLGDLRYGKEAQPEEKYRTLLNGNITFISGNHDRNAKGSVPSVRLTYGGEDFLLIHDPSDAPKSFPGWIIHGHHHNNNIRAFPFIDPAKKTINVSAEVIGYSPVSIREISEVIRDKAVPGGRPILFRYHYVRVNDEPHPAD